MKKFKEFLPSLDKARHIVKSISYRLYSTCITIMISSIVTGSTKIAFAIGTADFIIKIFTYYIHERIWFHIPFGLQRPRKIHTEITWNPNPETVQTQVAFLQHEEGHIRKRVKVTKNNETYVALLSSYNKNTKERFSDIIYGTKSRIEKELNIKI